MADETTKHLWEAEHEYYCSDGRVQETFDSWQDYVENAGDPDMDYNLLFRWDWEIASEDNEQEHDELTLYYMQQRKGYHVSVTVYVTPEDESAVREFLQKRFDHLLKLWSPLAAVDIADGLPARPERITDVPLNYLHKSGGVRSTSSTNEAVNDD